VILSFADMLRMVSIAGFGLLVACTRPNDAANMADDDDDGAAVGGAFPRPGSTATGADGSDSASTTGVTSSGVDVAGDGTQGSSEGGSEASGITGDTTGDDTGDETTGNADPLAVFDDEFDDAALLSEWTFRHVEEGEAAQYESLDVDATYPGFLTVVPDTSGWYDDYAGIFLFHLVSGNFMIETWVSAGRDISPSNPPSQFFNSAGLLVRDPSHGPGTEDWVMHNVGYQMSSVATEGKTTRNSLSALTVVDGPRQGVLRICRFGEDVVLTRRLDGEAMFTETHRYDRDDLPNQLQLAGRDAELFSRARHRSALRLRSIPIDQERCRLPRTLTCGGSMVVQSARVLCAHPRCRTRCNHGKVLLGTRMRSMRSVAERRFYGSRR
jgi:hypothetical protein